MVQHITRKNGGQLESVNQNLETYICCFCNTSLKIGLSGSLGPCTGTTTWRTSTGLNPYEALYERPPPSLLQSVPKTAKVQSVEDTLYEKDRVLKLLKDHLNLA